MKNRTNAKFHFLPFVTVIALVGLFLAPGASAEGQGQNQNGNQTAVSETLSDVQTEGTKQEVPTLEHQGSSSVSGLSLSHTSGPSIPGYGITYHGGKVLHSPNVYAIWYGNWNTPGNNSKVVLENLLQNIGGTPYFNVNTSYSDRQGPVSNSVRFVKSVTDNYSQGTVLTDNKVAAIVKRAITKESSKESGSNNSLPKDSNAVYFVFTSADVSETSGFLTVYCAWHAHKTIEDTNIKYAFVGDPSADLSACASQRVVSPNGNLAADSMASMTAHELEEAITDPNLNAWFDDATGYENADLCAFNYGKAIKNPDGSFYNMIIGGRQYLIQRNWLNVDPGSCASSY